MSFRKKTGTSEVSGDFSKLNNIITNLAKGANVKIGIFGGAVSNEGGATVAFIGSVHEFGYPEGNIPIRSFLKMPIEKKSKNIEKAAQKAVKDKIGDGNVIGILKIIGIAAENAVQEAFETGGFGTWPELDEKTIKRKKSSAILIDQGELRKAITSKASVGKK